MSRSLQLWIESALLGIFLFIAGTAYLFLQTDQFNSSLINRALAFSSLIMIDLSFVVSGTSYFWGIGKKYLGYRKMIGVTGFVMSLIHATTASYLFTGSVIWLTFLLKNPLAITPALLAITIMTMMVVVSNRGMPARLGATLWRQLLRVGYIAIFLLIIHASLMSYREWLLWFTTFNTVLPPLSIWAALFSVFTILIRIILFFSLRKKPPITTSSSINQPETTIYTSPNSSHS